MSDPSFMEERKPGNLAVPPSGWALGDRASIRFGQDISVLREHVFCSCLSLKEVIDTESMQRRQETIKGWPTEGPPVTNAVSNL